MVIKNLENKIKLVGIICSLFLAGCIIISMGSIWTARTMVADAQQKVYVLDGNVPILVNRTTMEETLDVEAKSHVEMFHHFFIAFDKGKMEFTYYGRQRIERRSNILMRELVTAGQLKRVPRTENNPHGLLIVNWRTLLNKDIEQKTKTTY